MTKRISSFERLSRSVRVDDVCEPAKCVVVDPREETIASVLRKYVRPSNEEPDVDAPILLRMRQERDGDMKSIHASAFPYAVLLPRRALIEAIESTDGGERYLDYEGFNDWHLNEPAKCLAHFKGKNILAGGVTLWDMLTSDGFALSADSAALVVRGIGSYGVITIETLLSRPEAKACWFAATLELEQSALHVCRYHAGKSLEFLSPERKLSLFEFFLTRMSAMKHVDVPPWFAKMSRGVDVDAYFGKVNRDMASNLPAYQIEYTQFADKKAMLLKSDIDLPVSKTRIKKIFEQAEKLRNWCAHPTSECELAIDHLGQLRDLIMDIHQLTEQLYEAASLLTLRENKG